MFKTQVCMVSGQAAPNFLPLLDDTLKPENVILLVTEAMREKAGYLQRVIQERGIKVRIEPFQSAGDFHQMQENLLNLLADHEPEQIALNVTGGTKWMAISAQEIFRINKSPVFYVDIDSGKILFLDSVRLPINIQNLVKLDHYLQAYGYTISNTHSCIKGQTEAQRQLCQTLTLYIEDWGNALGQINLLASEAQSSASLRVRLTVLGDRRDPHLEKLIKEFGHADILKKEGDLITFASEESRFFANGGWLEEYINSKLNELKSEGILQDSSKLNVTIQSPRNTRNEIDVAFMANNRLHLIECKTKNFKGKHAGSTGTDSLYKLDSLGDLGGLGTKSMLVSYRQLGQADAQRAKDLKIQVVQGRDIHNIKEALKKWIGRNTSQQ